MDLLIIRHGQSEGDILKRMEGRADFSLTELGLQQAAMMAKWASEYMTLDKIYSSTLKRAKQTAEVLSAAANTPVEFDDNLMEWNNGLIAGLLIDEANEKFPSPAANYPHTAVYGQESDIEFRARAETALSRIINENPPDSKIAIVSHGGMINRLFQSFLMLPTVSDVKVYSGDTCIHHLRIDENNHRYVVFANSLVHLNNYVS